MFKETEANTQRANVGIYVYIQQLQCIFEPEKRMCRPALSL